MALTLNNLVGFETNGLEEASATSGSPAASTTRVRTGDFSLELSSSADYSIAPFESISDAGDYQIVGIAVNFDVLSLTYSFMIAEEGSNQCWALQINGSGTLLIRDSGGNLLGSSPNLFSADTWYFIEVAWQHLDSGNIIVHVNGDEEFNASAKDLSQGGTFDTYRADSSSDDVFFDDFYCMSGGSGVSDFLGNCEVFRYQNRTNSATPDTGDNLDAGVWQDVGLTPLVEEATEVEYTGDPRSGDIFTDDTASGFHGRHGPHDDGNIDGTIKGAKWLHRLRRDGGGATNHYKRYGNDAEAESEAAVTLSTAYQNFFTVSEGATVVPLATEHFSMGVRVDGGQNMEIAEIWAFILHVPTAGAQLSVTLSESVSLAENEVQVPTKVLPTEGPTPNEALIQAVTKVLAESLAPSDALIRAVIKVLGESETVGEVVNPFLWLQAQLPESMTVAEEALQVLIRLRTLTESLSPAEALRQVMTKPLSEPVTPTDDLLQVVTKVLSESEVAAEVLLQVVTKVVAESLSPADALETVYIFVRANAESVTTSEALQQVITKVLAENMTVAEALRQTIQKVLAESLAPNDALVQVVRKVLAESVAPAEAVLQTFTKVLVESMTVGEALDTVLIGELLRILAESLSPADAVVKIAMKVLPAEGTTANEALRQAVTKVLVESLTPSEALTALLWLRVSLAEPITPADALVLAVTKVLPESVSSQDAVLQVVRKVLAEDITPAEALTQIVTKILSGESITAEDVVVWTFTKVLAESMTSQDAVSASIIGVPGDEFLTILAEAITVTDALALRIVGPFVARPFAHTGVMEQNRRAAQRRSLEQQRRGNPNKPASSV